MWIAIILILMRMMCIVVVGDDHEWCHEKIYSADIDWITRNSQVNRRCTQSGSLSFVLEIILLLQWRMYRRV